METICWHCGTRLPPPKRLTGRRRHYCSDACRQAARRAQRRALALPAAPDLDGDKLATVEQLIEVAFRPTDDPIEASTEVVLTLRAIAGRARRLAETAPPGLAWRHGTTAQVLDELIGRAWDVG
jgi:hypothetical protein